MVKKSFETFHETLLVASEIFSRRLFRKPSRDFPENSSGYLQETFQKTYQVAFKRLSKNSLGSFQKIFQKTAQVASKKFSSRRDFRKPLKIFQKIFQVASKLFSRSFHKIFQQMLQVAFKWFSRRLFKLGLVDFLRYYPGNSIK